MKLSICIPTYNRPYYLENCLNSIVIAKKKKKLNLKFVFPIMAQNIIYIKLLKNLKKNWILNFINLIEIWEYQ